MGSVCLSVWMSVTPLLQHLHNRMPKVNKGNQLERELEAEAKQALRASHSMQSTLLIAIYI
jgi:hypothetical protein